MSNTCLTCAKKSMVGGRYANKTRATVFTPTGKVRRYPNLQWARIPGGPRLKMCTRCIKAGKHIQLASL
jgi:ribosomal protein L28